MIKKSITYACAALLAFAFVSCQKKTDVERCLDAQTSLAETLQKINDKDSADKYADQVDSIMDQFFTLLDAIRDAHKEEEVKNHPQWRPLGDQMGKKEGQFKSQNFYGSEKLRAAFLKPRGK